MVKVINTWLGFRNDCEKQGELLDGNESVKVILLLPVSFCSLGLLCIESVKLSCSHILYYSVVALFLLSAELCLLLQFK